MRDRLIELQSKAWIEWQRSATDVDFAEYCAEYLLANGVIVPPARVGADIYRIMAVNHSVYKPFVATLPDKVEPYGIYYKGLMGEYRYIPFDEIGKTVFLSREAAEQALKGGAE